MLPALATWPILDAAFARYHAEPVVSAPARSRLHWVVAVLAGLAVSVLVGVASDC